MTRQEVRERYTVKNGIIRDPGKFEMQPEWVPAFWERFVDGFCDSDDGEVIRFRLTAEDRKEWGLKGGWVRLREDDQGFVEGW